MARSLSEAIARAAAEEGVSPDLLTAIASQESSGKANVSDSPAGAVGPFQIMPSTARALGFAGPIEDLRNPDVAAPLAARLLHKHLTTYGGDPGAAAVAYYTGSAQRNASGGYSKAPVVINGVQFPSAQEYHDQVLARMGGGQMPATMQNTMGADGLVAPNLPDVTEDTNRAIDDAYARLLKWHESNPVVDISKAYAPVVQSVENRPLPQTPGPWQSFFATMGSPSNAPGILAQRLQTVAETSAQKMRDLLAVKEALLHANLAQSAQEMDFRKSLTHAKELEKLHAQMGEIERQQTLNAQVALENAKVAGRREIEGLKSKRTMDAIEARAKTLASSMGLSGKLGDQFTAQARNVATIIDHMTAPNVVTGEEKTPEEVQDIWRWGLKELDRLAEEARTSQPKSNSTVTPSTVRPSGAVAAPTVTTVVPAADSAEVTPSTVPQVPIDNPTRAAMVSDLRKRAERLRRDSKGGSGGW